MERGEPTGLTREDIRRGRGYFEGQYAYVVGFFEDPTTGGVTLELGLGDVHLELYGYFSGEEFLVEDRKRLD